MESSKGPRNKVTLLQSCDFPQCLQKHHVGWKTSTSRNGTRKQDIHMTKTGTGYPSLILYKNKLRNIKDLNIKLEVLKTLQWTVGKTLQNTGTGNNILNRIPIAQEIRARTDKWDFIRLKIKWNSYQSEKNTYRVRENLCQPLIW
jgi:hypothetical protein